MTDETTPLTQALDQAVDRALSDTIGAAGGMIQAAVTIVSYLDANGERCWSMFTMPDQGEITTLGLVRLLTLAVEDQVLDRF